jgi:hypothetical protein
MTAMKTSVSRLVFLLLAWGVAASLAGAFELFLHIPPWVVPLLVAGLTVGFSVAVRRVEWMRQAVDALSVRAVLAAHLVRFVGIYFLWLHAQGRLPVEFAMRAGWGDIVAAVGALGLLFWPEGAGFRRALLAWNIFGAADLLVALGTGGWLNVVRPGSMIELAGLPLTLVPLWLVPVLLTSHLYLIEGYFRRGRDVVYGGGCDEA